MAALSKPVISLNMLDDYRSASDKGKISILKNFKFPNEKFRSSQYNSVKSAIISYLTDVNHDLRIFEERRKKLLKRNKSTKWQTRDVDNSFLALKGIEGYIEKLFRKYFKFSMVANRKSKSPVRNRQLNGVAVQMNPEIVMLDSNTNDPIGVIKLVFSKTKKVSPMKGQIITGFIKEYIEKTFKRKVEEINFLAYDVFHKQIISANTNFGLHRQLINKSLTEINQKWIKIEKK